jgi:hypothetical protein
VHLLIKLVDSFLNHSQGMGGFVMAQKSLAHLIG